MQKSLLEKQEGRKIVPFLSFKHVACWNWHSADQRLSKRLANLLPKVHRAKSLPLSK